MAKERITTSQVEQRSGVNQSAVSRIAGQGFHLLVFMAGQDITRNDWEDRKIGSLRTRFAPGLIVRSPALVIAVKFVRHRDVAFVLERHLRILRARRVVGRAWRVDDRRIYQSDRAQRDPLVCKMTVHLGDDRLGPVMALRPWVEVENGGLFHWWTSPISACWCPGVVDTTTNFVAHPGLIAQADATGPDVDGVDGDAASVLSLSGAQIAPTPCPKPVPPQRSKLGTSRSKKTVRCRPDGPDQRRCR